MVGFSTALAQQTDVYRCTGVSLPGDGQEGPAVQLLPDGALQAVSMAVA